MWGNHQCKIDTQKKGRNSRENNYFTSKKKKRPITIINSKLSNTKKINGIKKLVTMRLKAQSAMHK